MAARHRPTRSPRPGPDAGFAAVSEEHFERSKLVILGLATRDAHTVSPSDWAYERQLAGALLDDTRLYKQAAQARGLGALAGVMSDLELVLLQTSLTEEPDAATLNRLQRLIRKRDLVSKMEVSNGSKGSHGSRGSRSVPSSHGSTVRRVLRSMARGVDRGYS